MDLTTRYLGLELPHPLMPGASPMSGELDRVKQLQDAGAAAIVMHSLFEEQLVGEQMSAFHHLETHADSFAEASSYMPPPSDFSLGPEEYLEQVRRVKESTGLPVIGSLNGTSKGGWLEFARLIEQAGAAALELNVYYVAADPNESGEDVEQRVLEIVRAVTSEVGIPVAVKLSPFFSAMTHLSTQLVAAGAKGLVIFNRFYQPDLDLEALDVVPSLHLSQSSELALRIQWLALLSGRVDASLAVTGGVHSAADAMKSVMAGAHAVQLVSALLHHGPYFLRKVREGMKHWLEEHEYESLGQAQGSLSFRTCPDPSALERGNYAKLLQSWQF